MVKTHRLQRLLKNWQDGRIKMFTTWKTLEFRRDHPDLFREGEYIPLRVTGARHNDIIAFARRLHDEWVVVAVPRLIAGLTRPGSPSLGEKIWGDTTIELPADAPSRWTHVLTGEEVSALLLISKLFETLPLAVLR